MSSDNFQERNPLFSLSGIVAGIYEKKAHALESAPAPVVLAPVEPEPLTQKQIEDAARLKATFEKVRIATEERAKLVAAAAKDSAEKQKRKKQAEGEPAYKYRSPTSVTASASITTNSKSAPVKNGLSVTQIKGWHALLYSVRGRLHEREHTIPLDEFIKLSQYKRKDLSYLESEMDRLVTTRFRANLLGKSKGMEKAGVTAFLASANFKRKPGFIIFQFSEELKRILFDIYRNKDVFTLLSLPEVTSLKTKGAINFHCLIEDYKSLGRIPDTPLEEFKELLGVDKNEYPEFKDFNKWILQPAIKENSDHFKLTALYKRNKRRQVTSVSVKIEATL